MLLILLFFIIFSCPAEQLVRETWSLESGNHLLFRVSDESALAELSLFQSGYEDWKPGVLLLDTETFQIGSLQSSGIWKFSSMSTPVQQSLLRQKHGLVPNRSENSLQFPGAAYYHKGGGITGGGGMIQSREEMIQYSFWQNFNINMYSPLTLGFSKTHFDPAQEDADEWFDTEQIPGNIFYFTVADFKTELARSRFQLMAALSNSEFTAPGFSVLPAYTYFAGPHDITIRFWLNSDHWVNRNIEKPDWLQYGDSLARFRISENLLFTAKVYGGEKTSGIQQGYSLGLNRDTGFFITTIEYSLDRSLQDHQTDNLHSAEVSMKKNTGVWNYSAEGLLQYEDLKIASWQIEGGVSRRHWQGMTSNLRVRGSATPGVIEIKPLFEESWQMKELKWKAVGGYIIDYSEHGAFSAESLVLKIQLEWSPD